MSTSHARSRWTPEEITILRGLMTATGGDLGAAARAMGRTKAEVDLALWAALGRTADDAAIMVNWQAPAPTPPPFGGDAA